MKVVQRIVIAVAVAATTALVSSAASAAPAPRDAALVNASSQLRADWTEEFHYGQITNALPFTVTVTDWVDPNVRLTVAPGAKGYIPKDCAGVLIHATDGGTQPMIARIIKYREHTGGPWIRASTQNPDGTTHHEVTQKFETKTLGFPSGRVIRYEPSQQSGGGESDTGNTPDYLTIGGRSDLPSGGSNMTFTNQSTRQIKIDDAALAQNQSLTRKAIKPGTARTAFASVTVPGTRAPSSFLYLTQGAARYETLLAVSNSDSGQDQIASTDVRDRLNQLIGAGTIADNVTCTVVRNWDNNGQANFTVTFTDTPG